MQTSAWKPSFHLKTNENRHVCLKQQNRHCPHNSRRLSCWCQCQAMKPLEGAAQSQNRPQDPPPLCPIPQHHADVRRDAPFLKHSWWDMKPPDDGTKPHHTRDERNQSARKKSEVRCRFPKCWTVPSNSHSVFKLTLYLDFQMNFSTETQKLDSLHIDLKLSWPHGPVFITQDESLPPHGLHC